MKFNLDHVRKARGNHQRLFSLLRDYTINLIFISDSSSKCSFKALRINVQRAAQISEIQEVESRVAGMWQVQAQALEVGQAWARCPGRNLSASVPHLLCR